MRGKSEVIKPIDPPEDLPRAWGGCTCMCHKVPAKHVMACCHPTKEELEELLGIDELKEMENDSEV